jgi:hypothetical protein
VPTCQSWRPVAHRKHPEPGVPGACKYCWTTCKNDVRAGQTRCAECLELLLNHSNDEVRRSLVFEPGATTETLTRLVDDFNFSISLEADQVLEQRHRALDPIGGRTRATAGFPSNFQWNKKD